MSRNLCCTNEAKAISIPDLLTVHLGFVKETTSDCCCPSSVINLSKLDLQKNFSAWKHCSSGIFMASCQMFHDAELILRSFRWPTQALEMQHSSETSLHRLNSSFWSLSWHRLQKNFKIVSFTCSWRNCSQFFVWYVRICFCCRSNVWQFV